MLSTWHLNTLGESAQKAQSAEHLPRLHHSRKGRKWVFNAQQCTYHLLVVFAAMAVCIPNFIFVLLQRWRSHCTAVHNWGLGICSTAHDTEFKLLMSQSIGNPMLFTICHVAIGTVCVPFMANRLTQLKHGSSMFLGRYKTQVSLVILLQTALDLSPAFAIVILDESCLRCLLCIRLCTLSAEIVCCRYYISFTGDLGALVCPSTIYRLLLTPILVCGSLIYGVSET